MKFRCDSCGQKYSVADEKASGKTLKIRCRKCGHTIRVTGPPATPPEEHEATRAMPAPQLKEALRQTRGSTGESIGLKPERAAAEARGQTGSAAALEPAAAASPEEKTRLEPPPPPEPPLAALDPVEAWYAVILGKQEGPMDLASLREAVVAGRITRRTYVWSESIDDWRPISSVTRLRPLLDELAAPPPPPPPRANSAAGTLQMRMDDIVAAEAKAKAKAAAEAHAASEGSNGSLDDSLAAAIEQATQEAQAGFGETDALAEEEPDPFRQALAEEALADPFADVPDGPDISDPDAPPRETTQMFILASGVNKRRSPIRIAAALLVLFGFLGGTAYLLTLTGIDLKGLIPAVRGKESPTWEGGPVDEERARLIREQLLGGNRAQPGEGAAAGSHKGTGKRRNGNAGHGATDPVDTDPVVTKEERVVTELTDADKAAVAALYGGKDSRSVQIKVKAKDTKEGVDSAESPIDPEVVAKKIGETQKAFQNCVQQELRRNPGFEGGRVMLTISVLPSGIVKGASLDNRGLHLSDVGVCIRRSIKRVVFPSFGGDDAVDFEVPLVLSTGY